MANPLLSLHGQSAAELQDYGGTQIVLTFGEPQAEYAAIRKAAAIIDAAQRGVLEVSGDDRHAFLNGLLTNQIRDPKAKTGLADGRAVFSFLLNPKGRIIADMNVVELGGRTLLEMDVRLIEPVQQALEKHLFRERVSIANRSTSLHELMLAGPEALAALNRAVRDRIQPLAPIGAVQDAGTAATAHLLGQEVVVFRDDVCGTTGLRMIVRVEAATSVWTHFTAEASRAQHPQDDMRFIGLARPTGWAAFNSARIEAGRPICGIDFDDTVLPGETGQLARAVSFTKGCYVGQEIVARMHTRGQLARLLVGIRMEDDALPIAGVKMYDEQQNEIGGITSSTLSPMLSDAAIALGYVKRGFEALGTRLRIPAEGAVHVGIVSALPFV